MTLPGQKAAVSIVERRALRSEYVPRFRDALKELMGMETSEIMKVLDADPGTLGAWVEEFYPEHSEAMKAALITLVLDYGSKVVDTALDEVGSTATVPTEQFSDQYTGTMVSRWTGSSIAQIRQMVRDEPEELTDAVTERMDKWSETRHVWSGEKEATQAGGAFARLAYTSSGVQEMVWRAGASACPLCRRMDGKRISVTELFAQPGDTIEPVDSEEPREPLTVESRIGHPPLHGLNGSGGVCDCLVAAS